MTDTEPEYPEIKYYKQSLQTYRHYLIPYQEKSTQCLCGDMILWASWQREQTCSCGRIYRKELP
jgi:hypothetical protein